ncbi:Uncharacterized protein Adt_24790 [Abeliophyllum distichum]|uniref:Uncharacterized protein n=1 Tax=Abeliophyllum distichum TaxID=126358 RepID=A0ABD1SES6_9LAMI
MNRARTGNRQTPILPVTQSDNPPSKPTRVHRLNPRLSVQTPRHVKPSTYYCLHCNYVLFVIGAVLTFAANVALTYVDFFTYDVSGYLLMKLMHIGSGGQTPVNLDEGNQADGGVGTSLLVLLASDKADEDFGLLDGITALALGVVVRVPEHQIAVAARIAIGFSLRHFIPLLGSNKELAFGRLER